MKVVPLLDVVSIPRVRNSSGGISREQLTRGEVDGGEFFKHRSHVFIYVFERTSSISLVFSFLTLYK